MHPGAFEFVARYKTDASIRVIEIGSRIINDQASIRTLFPKAEWIGLDVVEGPGVDVLCNAICYVNKTPCDIVICCEVLEHCSHWPELIVSAERFLRVGGTALITCAGLGREPHSAIDGGTVCDGEWYGNIRASELALAIESAGLTLRILETNQHWRDVYAAALKH